MRTPLMAMCAALLLLPGAAAAQTGMVEWAVDRLTVHAINAPLKELVEEVARRTGIVLTGADRLAGRHSFDFRDTRLPEAVRILLEQVNYIITTEQGGFHIRVHSMSTSAADVVANGPVHIPGLTDRTPGQSDVVNDLGVDVEEEVDEDEQEELESLTETVEVQGARAMGAMTEAAHSEYVSVRIHALQLLGRHRDPAAITPLIDALGDDDLDVALTASDVLAAMPGAIVVDALAGQLLEGVDPDAQFAALRALALRADIASLPHVRRAAQDAHPLLREHAAALLKELEARAKAAANPKG